ncbi:MAG TPA: phenylacetic acid degradation bifunctional protein PaaZ [Stenotrophomonas sp.]|nr:phenylacetic acid degradation bifunctional protein PaaZ [Stenotrophomonas sp.]
MQLHSYAQGQWRAGTGGLVLAHAISGAPVATISSQGLDFAGMLAHARQVGGPALRAATFHERALMLKALAQYLLARKETYYALSPATGATRHDAWIDIEGGIGTLFAYSSKGRRELPNAHFLVEGASERLSRQGSFVGQHIAVPRRGVAVHINAFNFPCWGMLEKLSVNLLAGMPAIVKPASQTAYLAEAMFRDIIASGVLPEGAVQLICGGVGDLFDHLLPQDVVTFTGSASTGHALRSHPSVQRHSVRFTMEADSLNFSLLGPDAVPGEAEFDLFVEEVAREMTVKAGQKCTAIRRALVPRALLDPICEALRQRLQTVRTGDPASAGVTMGALASLAQREEVRERVAELQQAGAELVHGDPWRFELQDADPLRGAFLPPLLLRCRDPHAQQAVHEVEAFGPVATLMPFDDTEDAIALARRGGGSLVGSLFTADAALAREIVLGVATEHGRLLVIDRHCAAESTGHGSPLPALVHGGPGRAGGGEEMGGIRGVMHYLQRTALQGSPDALSTICEQWIEGAARDDSVHPFRKTLEALRPGDSVVSAERSVSLADIEHFAEFTGDTFYVHTDEAAAAANPFFGTRAAHGYLVVSLAAGLFVDPAPGPVLANYGVDSLRFLAPVFPGDRLRVVLTCKQKNPRAGHDYGEVRWDAQVSNQRDEIVARYDVLTLVQRGEGGSAITEPAPRAAEPVT